MASSFQMAPATITSQHCFTSLPGMQCFSKQSLIEKIKLHHLSAIQKRVLHQNNSQFSCVVILLLLWSVFKICILQFRVNVIRVWSYLTSAMITIPSSLSSQLPGRLSQNQKQTINGTVVESNLQLLITKLRTHQIVTLFAIVICRLTQIWPSVGKPFFISQLASALLHANVQLGSSQPSGCTTVWVKQVIFTWCTLARVVSFCPVLVVRSLMSVCCLNNCDQKLAKHRHCQSVSPLRNYLHHIQPGQSLISRYTFCLLVSCCFLLPQRASFYSIPSEPPNGPLATFSASKLRTTFISVPRPLPLHSAGDNSSQICPLFMSTDESDSNVASSNSTASSDRPNPCVCYGADSSGIFVECTSATLSQINGTLSHLRPHRTAVRSLSIYRLNATGSMPKMLFEPFSSITELHISSSNMSQIGSDLTFSGLEDCLRTLSFVNSQISTIPKSTLSKLRQLQSLKPTRQSRL